MEIQVGGNYFRTYQIRSMRQHKTGRVHDPAPS